MKNKIPLLDNPYRFPGAWIKGAFHFHTTNSDGKIPPLEAVRRYAAKGYRVAGVTDHHYVTILPPGSFPRLLTIPSAEIAWPHLLHIGARGSGKLPSETIPRSIKRIKRDGGFSVLCHPGWSDCSWKDLWNTWPVDAVEIYNHLCQIENATGFALERWDMVLQSGRKVWGFATDDSHFNKTYPQYAGGWVMIKTPSVDRASVMRALKTGRFYSSSGPELRSLSTQKGRITLATSPIVSVRALADGVGAGKVLFSRRPRTRWTVDYSGWWCQPKTYVRLELIDARGRAAWTNPLFVLRRR